MTATLGTALVQSGTVYIERFGVAYADLGIVDDVIPPTGTMQTLTIGSLAYVGAVTIGGDFGGQGRAHWSAGTGGWFRVLPARPYHDDGGIMLSRVLADLERDAATAVGLPALGTALEVPDVRLDVAGSWIRPTAAGRDLLDALAAAAGQPRGAWWVAPDGSTHIGPRPASTVTLSDLTVTPFDPALLRAVVRVASDNFAPLLPGATLTAPGVAAPLSVATLILQIDGHDISAEVWSEVSGAALFAKTVRAIVDPSIAYLAARPYSVTSVAGDGRVAVAGPPGSAFPDAPLLGHAPGIPGASYTMAPGAAVLVSCVGGSPGAPVCVAYPPGELPVAVGFDAAGTVTAGGPAGSGNALALAVPLLAWIGQLAAVLAAHGITAPAAPACATTKALGV